MKIGYLHLGSAQHGIRRYGERLATEARQRGLSVIEADVNLTGDRRTNQTLLMQAAQELSTADVIHFQHNKLLWGEQLQQHYLQVFIRNCSAPLVATLHDVYIQQSSFDWKKPVSYVEYLKAKYGSTALFLRWLSSQIDRILVCTEQEADRLKYVVGNETVHGKRIRVIPHFVEERAAIPDPTSARKALKLENFSVITLLGWLFPRKGHRLMVEAIPNLPSDVKVIFAGRPSEGCEWFAEELLTLAKSLEVEDRLHITGYLSEEELEQYLAATDVAICPFENCSASGSLSTLISVAHPKILASDLPQLAEYNQLSPGAIHTFQPYTSTALAQAIRDLLVTPASPNSAVLHLQARLSMSTVFDEHLQQYRQVSPVGLTHSLKSSPTISKV